MEFLFDESITLICIIAFSAFIHGALGFGFPLVATPLIALFSDVQTAILATIIPTMMVNTTSIIRGGNWNLSIKQYYPLIFYIFVGTVCGSFLLLYLSSEFLQIFLALTILFYLQKERIKFIRFDFIHTHQRFSKALFGTLSGLVSGTTNVMIAVIFIYINELSLGIVASIQVMNMCFLSAKTTQLLFFTSQGTLDMQFLAYSLVYALIGFGAIFLGFRIRDRFSTQTYKKLLNIFLYIIAILLLFK